jgi:hypothetical protein
VFCSQYFSDTCFFVLSRQNNHNFCFEEPGVAPVSSSGDPFLFTDNPFQVGISLVSNKNLHFEQEDQIRQVSLQMLLEIGQIQYSVDRVIIWYLILLDDTMLGKTHHSGKRSVETCCILTRHWYRGEWFDFVTCTRAGIPFMDPFYGSSRATTSRFVKQFSSHCLLFVVYTPLSLSAHWNIRETLSKS